MSDLCPKCGGGVWPGREVTRCVDPFHTLNAPQPPPTSDDASPEVWPALLDEVALSPELRALCEERDAMGRAKYGTALRVHNGREPLVDALQEALDLAVYLHQAVWRVEGPARRRRMCRLRNHALDLAQELLEEVSHD